MALFPYPPICALAIRETAPPRRPFCGIFRFLMQINDI
jgi:hypothetical protein